jgi:hypothetical protein
MLKRLLNLTPRRPRKRWRHLPDFLRDRASTAGLEFALVITPMFFIVAGIYDLSEACIIRAEIYNAAQTMVASASSEAVQADGSTALTYDQIQQVESSIWALVPTLRNGLHNGTPMSITMSSLLFYTSPLGPCVFGQKTPCQYFADPVWSESYTGGDSNVTFPSKVVSNCGGIQTSLGNQVPGGTVVNGDANVSTFDTLNVVQSAATLPASNPAATSDGAADTEVGISPVLVVNIQYTYTPVFTFFILKSFTFWVDGYWPIRSLKKIAPVTNNIGFGTYTIQPLTNAFTTINGASLSASDATSHPTYWCIDNGVQNPGPTS